MLKIVNVERGRRVFFSPQGFAGAVSFASPGGVLLFYCLLYVVLLFLQAIKYVTVCFYRRGDRIMRRFFVFMAVVTSRKNTVRARM